ncbi:MAG: hypothetical protein DME18_14220 [Verrucomicrobia bacterium]|nr:MAG: hypothetical protein DME18_14220 [Verrucomicrobiota bacterium]
MQPLRSAEMFKGMGEADLTSLENFSRLKSLQAGQHVFKEADAGDGFYFIIRGRIQISARFGDNQRRVFATFGPGEFFGEMAVLDDAPRSADAIADEASEVYFIPRENLAEILERNPKLAMRMLRDFSRRLREFDRKYIEEALQVERLVTVGDDEHPGRVSGNAGGRQKPHPPPGGTHGQNGDGISRVYPR